MLEVEPGLMGEDCEGHFGDEANNYAREIAFLFLLIIPFANAQPVSFNYNFSYPDDVKQVNLQGNFSILDSAIQLAVHPNGTKITSVGRVTSPKLVHLWNKTSNELKSFTTLFDFKLLSNRSPSPGHGLTFFLANQNLSNVNDTTNLGAAGLGIGRVDNQTLLPTEYNFVAVEFDTFSNHWDMEGPHVGVNVNSMLSDIAAKWLTHPSSSPYRCSIEYDSGDSYLTVKFTGYQAGVSPITQHLSYHINLSDYLEEWVIVGISAATGDGCDEQHTLLSWSFNQTEPTNAVVNTGKNWLTDKLLWEGLGIGLALCVSLVVLVRVLLCMMNKGQVKEEDNSETASDLKMDDEFQMGTGPVKISYEELVSATNNFRETEKLGEGGFGCVYKGYLKDLNSYAAIKKISADSTQGVKEYAAEVTIISQLRHRNLVKLVGWCHKQNNLFLIYEYMPNGSLDSRLFGGEDLLTWQVRYNVALGLAAALLYLQEEWEKCVLHRDMKSSNVMLDSNFNAKLGDFGLARLTDHEKGSHTTVMAGTIGYLAPEYMSSGKATKESDIFGFGVVLLEVATGKKAIHHKHNGEQVSLVEWVWELYTLRNLLAAADPNLCGEFDVHQMQCLLVVGLWCANPDSTSRPSIKQAIKVLNFEAPLPILPQHIPVLAYFPPTDDLFFTLSSSSSSKATD